jgi:hypothetical protein
MFSNFESSFTRVVTIYRLNYFPKIITDSSPFLFLKKQPWKISKAAGRAPVSPIRKTEALMKWLPCNKLLLDALFLAEI